MDQLAGLEAFAAVVNTGSFSQAAKYLGLNKSLISKRVAALEDSLNVKLLHRSTRQIAVTETGYAFFEHCQNILNEFSLAKDLISQEQIELEGTIRISAPISYGKSFIVPLLFEFMEIYPKITINLCLNDQFENILAEGYDLVIRIGELKDSNLITRKIGICDRIICASPNYIKRFENIAQPSDLNKHTILHYGLQKTGIRWYFYRKQVEHTLDLLPKFCVNNTEALLDAVILDHGIAMLPKFIAENALSENKLIPILNDYQIPPLNINLLWPLIKSMSVRVSLLKEFLIEKLKQNQST